MPLPPVRRCLATGVTAAIALSGAAALVGEAPASAATPEANSFLTATNAIRVFFRDRPVQENSTLDAKAQWWADVMAMTDTLAHSNLAAGLQSLPWMMLGENVGRAGPGGNADQAIENAFVNSMPHFFNMINPAWTSMGVGVARSSDGTVWVAEEFAQLG